MQTQTTLHNNQSEVSALAACYRLLLQKAQERRARLEIANVNIETAESVEEPHAKEKGS